MNNKTYIVLNIDSEWSQFDVEKLDELKPIKVIDSSSTYITIQSNELIRFFKKKELKLLPEVIDLECFLKQMLQEGSDLSSKPTWSALRFLHDQNEISSDFKLKSSTSLEFVKKLYSVYLSLLNSRVEEKERFEKIEKPINTILYSRQLKGIKINRELAEERCEELEDHIYKIKNILQLEHLIFDPENERFQFDYLKTKNYNIVQTIPYTLKIRRNSDSVCTLLYDLSRAKKDLNSILIMLTNYGGREIVHPSYKGFGTITSRITMREPSIQNMRTSNRDIIVPHDNKKFCYVDYGQFEAGILASLSKDKKLIELYNEDIYLDIAKKTLNSENEREEAKIIFYRFMYGDESLPSEVYKYFDRFKQLKTFINNINLELKEKEIIYSVYGNGRKSGEKSSWALSHKIQSTASLIYKKALLRTHKEIAEADFVIPMHDATVYEIPSEEDNTELIKKIINIYKEEFKTICPDLEPQVTLKKFYENKKTSTVA
jgi:DNA polymerase I-like protein with 3'-5' exonuclease and polymerase domains